MSQGIVPERGDEYLSQTKAERDAARKKQSDEQRAIEQMKRRAEERLQKVARDGYKAKTRGQSINLNPYSKDTQPSLHAAWKAGFEYEPGEEPLTDGSSEIV